MKHSVESPAPSARSDARTIRCWHRAGLAALLALIALGLAWELVLAPLRPGGSWWALKVLPLCAALPGFWHGRRYTFQWMSMAVLLYFTESIVRATSENGLSATLGWIGTALSLALFAACLAYARLTAPSRMRAA